MRIIHTSDWHAGRVWKGIPRQPELNAVLDHLGNFAERERVDLLLVSGDVFDNATPMAEAERSVFNFLKRMGKAGIQTVLIGGNHDSPARLEAWGTLAELVGVRVVARPNRADRGGVVEIEARSGEKARVAALPFTPARALVKALELAGDDLTAHLRYADGIARMVANLSSGFRPDAVNLMMAHTHLEGARFAGTERSVHLGADWAALPNTLPPKAQYVALGHIHCPQAVETAPAPTRYAGSPLQFDFGEAGEQKSFVFIDARPGQRAQVELVPYEGGTPVLQIKASLRELERHRDEFLQAGWLGVTVPLSAPDPDLNRKVRKLLPNAVKVEPLLPESATPAQVASTRGLSPTDLLRAYYRTERLRDADQDVVDAFTSLYTDEEGPA
jgi:exonuclease SbcD